MRMKDVLCQTLFQVTLPSGFVIKEEKHLSRARALQARPHSDICVLVHKRLVVSLACLFIKVPVMLLRGCSVFKVIIKLL